MEWSRQSAGKEWQDLGRMLILRSRGGVLWGFQVILRLVISHQNSRVLERYMVSPLRGTQGEDPDRQARLYQEGYWGSCIRNLHITCDSAGCYLGHVLPPGANVSLRPLKATWPTNWMPRQQYRGVA